MNSSNDHFVRFSTPSRSENTKTATRKVMSLIFKFKCTEKGNSYSEQKFKILRLEFTKCFVSRWKFIRFVRNGEFIIYSEQCISYIKYNSCVYVVFLVEVGCLIFFLLGLC